MPRTSRDGKPIRRVLGWLLNRDLTDGDLAQALEVDKTYFSRHKEDDDFPSFEDIHKLAVCFGLCERALQISFGYRSIDELILLDREGMRQYMEAGGGNYPNPDRDVVRKYVDELVEELKADNAELHTMRLDVAAGTFQPASQT